MSGKKYKNKKKPKSQEKTTYSPSGYFPDQLKKTKNLLLEKLNICTFNLNKTFITNKHELIKLILDNNIHILALQDTGRLIEIVELKNDYDFHFSQPDPNDLSSGMCLITSKLLPFKNCISENSFQELSF